MANNNLSRLTIALDQIIQDTANPAEVYALDGIHDNNGLNLAIDVSIPSDTVDKAGRIVLNANNRYDFANNVAYQIWILRENWGEAGHRAITAEDVDNASDALAHCAHMHFTDVWMGHTNLPLTYRATDIITVAALGRLRIPANITEFANRYTNAVAAAGSVQDLAFDNYPMFLHALGATQLHRFMHGGHTCFTQALANPRSTTAKCTAVGGATKEGLITYLRKDDRGHRGFHAYSNAAIKNVTYALSGEPILGGAGDNAVAAKVQFTTDFQYMGSGQQGQLVENVFKVSEAFKDRIPPGQQGKGGLITGFECMSTVVSHMSTKVKIPNAGMVLNQMAIMTTNLKNHEIHRPDLLALRGHYAGHIAFCYGYCQSAIEDFDEEAHPSLAKLAADNSGSRARGRALGLAIKEAPTHTEALASAIASTLSSFATAFSATPEIHDQGAPATEVGDEVPAVTAAEVSKGIEVGADEQTMSHTRMMQTLRTATGNTFYDANAGP